MTHHETITTLTRGRSRECQNGCSRRARTHRLRRVRTNDSQDAGQRYHDNLMMIRPSTLPVNRDGPLASTTANGLNRAPIRGSLPPMKRADLFWSVVYAFIFWSGLAVGLSFSIASFPLLVVVAAGVNLFMLVSSSPVSGRFPTDEKIQTMEDHVLRKYVKAPVSRVWTELQVTPPAGGADVKCVAHSLSVRCHNDQAPTLLLIHGTAASGTSYAECFDSLSQDFHIVALDLPGFGRSTTELDSTAKGRQTLQEMGTTFWVDFIEKFLESQNLHTVILMGHSYGAFISLHFAADKPQRISQLILLDSAGIFPTLGKLGSYWAVAFKFSVPQLLRYFLAPAGAWVCLAFFWTFGYDTESRYWFGVTQHPRGWGDRCVANDISLSWFGAYWNRPALPTLLNLTCPVLTIYGEEDDIMPIHQGRLLEQIKGIPCVSVPNAGHSPFHGNDALFLSEAVRDSSQECRKSDKTLRLPEIQWHTYRSTFNTKYTSNVIENLYNELRGQDYKTVLS